MALEIMKVLVVSTAHITQQENTFFDQCVQPVAGLGEPDAVPCGYLVWVGDAEEHEVDFDAASEGLAGIVRLAWANGLQWVRFDRDGMKIEGVPTYDW